jgi:hypothetical protein
MSGTDDDLYDESDDDTEECTMAAASAGAARVVDGLPVNLVDVAAPTTTAMLTGGTPLSATVGGSAYGDADMYDTESDEDAGCGAPQPKPNQTEGGAQCVDLQPSGNAPPLSAATAAMPEIAGIYGLANDFDDTAYGKGPDGRDGVDVAPVGGGGNPVGSSAQPLHEKSEASSTSTVEERGADGGNCTPARENMRAEVCGTHGWLHAAR